MTLFIIADISKNNEGTDHSVMRTLQRHIDQKKIGWSRVSIIARPDQQPIKAEFRDVHDWKEVNDFTEARSAVANHLHEISTQGAATAVQILSHYGRVLGLANDVWQGIEVTSIPFTALRNQVSEIGPGEWQFAHVVSLERALSALAKVVEAGATRQCDLRSRLAFVEPALDVKESGMMGQLVAIARQRGLIETRVVDAPGNPVIEQVRSRSRAAHNGGTESRPSVAARTGSRNGQQSSPFFSRKLGNILRDRGMGPYAQVRTLVFDELDRLAEADQGNRFGEVVRKAVLNVKQSLESKGHNTNQPWVQIEEFVVRIVTMARAAFDPDGNAIEPGFRAVRCSFGSLASDWRLKAEAELVRCLVSSRDDISMGDLKEVARAIFHTGDSWAIDRVYAAVESLLDAGTVSETAHNGKYYLQSEDHNGQRTGHSLRMAK